MIIAIDFDGTIVEQDKPYDQIDGEFRLKEGAERALWAMKRAGHQLLLWSARAAPHLRSDWRTNVLWRAKPDHVAIDRVERSYELNERRYREMRTFVHNRFGDLFDAIDDGTMGKPSVDLIIDDKAVQFGGSGVTWADLEDSHGEPADK